MARYVAYDVSFVVEAYPLSLDQAAAFRGVTFSSSTPSDAELATHRLGNVRDVPSGGEPSDTVIELLPVREADELWYQRWTVIPPSTAELAALRQNLKLQARQISNSRQTGLTHGEDHVLIATAGVPIGNVTAEAFPAVNEIAIARGITITQLVTAGRNRLNTALLRDATIEEAYVQALLDLDAATTAAEMEAIIQELRSI